MTTPAPVATPPLPGPAASTHACARCGAPVPLHVGLCERCNPLGLRDSASSQVHGTVFLAIVMAVLGLAVAARLATAGIGPFRAEVASIVANGAGLTVTLAVTNEGTATGSTTCRIVDPASTGTARVQLALSPRVAAGETIRYDVETTVFGDAVIPLNASCSAP